jgi:NhaA family Na+:H+ antiporter
MDIRPDLERQVDKLRGPFAAFVKAQTTASGLLLLALLMSLVLANSPLAGLYTELQHYRVGLHVGERAFDWSLLHFVNDGLIAVFFFLIGLEVKRELLAGELQDRARVRLLLGAALGGMLLPACIYLGINALAPDGEVHGWGIPMATDTALAIGVLAALGARAPRSVVAFLVGLAILDDIGAILVIALFYTERLALEPLAVALALLLVKMLFNRAGIRHPFVYMSGAILLWLAIVQSGIHASIAGVIAAATVPARPRIKPDAMKRRLREAVADVPADPQPEHVLGEAQTHRQITEVERLAQESTTPVRRWENGLELPVALIVLPLFVFLNAGIPISSQDLFGSFSEPVALGILLGLVVGKPAGILAGVWLSERLAGARRPPELTFQRLLGVGLLAGVGFTMSTFIANLALGVGSAALQTAKLAIVMASAVAATAGYLALRRSAAPD